MSSKQNVSGKGITQVSLLQLSPG